MDTQNELKTLSDQVIMNTYARYPIVLTKGKDCIVWDNNNTSYIDFIAGIAVCNVGHGNESIAQAIYEQAKTLVHVSNLYYTEPQIRLANWLTHHSFADKVFFCNSGAEANEAAIKLTRKYFYDKGQTDRFQIITMKHSFHGRTMATLTATGQEKVKKGFAPYVPGFSFVPFNDLDAVKNAINANTAAIMLEPIQGEGGVCCPDTDYLPKLRQLCDDHGILLIFDEIQTGMGRTGCLFAHEHYQIVPDIMTLAKGIANGLPMGCMLAKDSVAKSFSAGSHASTFGGNPVAASAAMAMIQLYLKNNIIEHCREIGAYFKQQLDSLNQSHEIIKEVRGKGLLLGIVLDTDGAPFVDLCLKKGFLINCIQGNILRFAPPLIITKEHIDSLIQCLDSLFKGKASH